jgi:hypothetical protein
LAAFFAGAAFLTGLASDEESLSEDESFLAAFLDGAAAFLTSLTDSSESLSEEEAAAFFCGTFWFSDVFFALLLLEAETFESALALLTGFSSEESLSEELELSCFLETFLELAFFSASLTALFFESS